MEHLEFIREIPSGKTIILFIHGILGTPNHFRDMISKAPINCSIYNVLLDGHGGKANDFSKSSMSKWKKQIDLILTKLSDRYENILIVAHSMGTLFALSASINNPKVKALFLLATPLKIFVKPKVAINSFRVLFDKIDINNPEVVATQNAYGIIPDKHLYKYIKWIPNYLSLFSEIRRTRKIIKEVKKPCFVFQSGKDELVSGSSIKYIKLIKNVKCNILKNSGHYYYDKEDYAFMLDEFKVFCDSFIL